MSDPLPGPDEAACRCGAPARPAARFCPACGAALGGAERPPPILPPAAPPPRLGKSPELLERRAARIAADHAWRQFRTVLVFFALLLGETLLWLLYSGDPRIPLAVSSATFTVLTAIFAFGEREEILAALHPRGLAPWKLLHGLAVFAVAGAAAAAWLYGAYRLGIPWEDPLEGFGPGGWWIGWAVLLWIVQPAIVEEIACRGFVQGRIRRLAGRTEAWILSSVFFAVLHLSPAVFVSHFLLGLGLAVARDRTGSLLPGMIAHGLWNTGALWLET